MRTLVYILVLDFAYGYQLVGHVIWHGHFLILWSPNKVPLKNFSITLSYLYITSQLLPVV